jgi:serine phosphatase RsbU (regulator of sigma subunit)
MFVTCLAAILDSRSGRLQYANAGHDLPYLRHADGVSELRATGMPLGLMPNMSYEQKEIALKPGESVLLYSDGLVEAHNPRREMFGFPRMQRFVGAHPGGATLIDCLLAELDSFTGEEWEQEDDIALLTLQRFRS